VTGTQLQKDDKGENTMEKQNLVQQAKDPFVPAIVRSYVVVSLVSVVVYKIAITPCAFQFDFTALLSLALAVFAVALSALFYFKATETSNAFYDNTYKFSQDIAGLLVRIESGFGERLKHLDDSYTSMRDQLQRYPDTSGVAGAKQEIKEEQQQLQEKVKERDQMIQELLARTQMQESERSDFLSRLKEREKELETARQEMQLLQRRLRSISRPDIVPEGLDLTPSMRRYIQNTVIERIGKEYVMEAPPPLVRRRFLKYASLFHPQFINDMKKRELMTEENELTIKGFQVLRSIANGSLCNGETT
jgi:hypothetical protein